MPEASSTPPAVQRLSALDVDLAPAAPGIYAWYGQLGLGPHDWRPQPKDGSDLAVGYLTKAMADFARVHQPSPIRLKGDGTYGLGWTGTLRRASIADTGGTDDEPTIHARLAPLIGSPDVRQLLVMLLREATPVFASPLYIGVATNLRSRLAEHLKSYEDARQLIRRDPVAAKRLQFDGGDFGARLAGTGLQLEHIICWVIQADLEPDAEGGSMPSASAREVAEAAEWILQRTFLPVLGRR
ncbi:MAG TPA: hypothetical protein VFP89_11415 [Propionibacteriaceae bacterium]|nr:hypothetical protein [Propionibacteriaceae bacterium]